MRLDKHSLSLQEELGPSSDFINSMNYGNLSDEDRERLIAFYNAAIQQQAPGEAGGLYSELRYISQVQPIGSLGPSVNTFGSIYEQFLGGEFPLVNAPQVLRDMYDYNGDGIIGANDITLMYLIGDTISNYIANGGEWNEVAFLTPAEYQARWQEINELYGLNLPNPDGFNQVMINGELEEWSDITGRDGRWVAGGSYYVYGNPPDLNYSGGWQINYETGTVIINGETQPTSGGNPMSTAGRIMRFLSGNSGSPEIMIAMYGFDTYMGLMAEYDFNGDGVIGASGYIDGGPFNDPTEPGGFDDAWTLWTYYALMLKIRQEMDSDFEARDVTAPSGASGMLDALRGAFATANFDVRTLFRGGGSATGYLYQLLLQLIEEMGGLGLPDQPDDQRGEDEDTIGYEELIKLLGQWGEGGTNFQDLLQLLSDYGQPVPPPPPETGSNPRP